MGDAGVDPRLGLVHLLEHEGHVGDDDPLGQVVGQRLLLSARERELYMSWIVSATKLQFTSNITLDGDLSWKL